MHADDANRPVLVIDAFNVMRSGWPWALPQELVDAAAVHAYDEDLDVVIVFDGPVRVQPAGGLPGRDRLTLVPSENEIADDTIVRGIELLAGRGRDITVATSDRELRDRVSDQVSQCIGGGSMARTLRLH